MFEISFGVVRGCGGEQGLPRQDLREQRAGRAAAQSQQEEGGQQEGHLRQGGPDNLKYIWVKYES